MGIATTVTAALETPIFMPVGDEFLFGVFTEPSVKPNGIGVIVTQSEGRNRVMVRLARRLAGLGFHVLRFDLHGRGESTGVVIPRLDRPFVEDVDSAVGYMKSEGIDRIIFVGKCFGARTALAAAPSIDGLLAIVCVATSVLSGDVTKHLMEQRRTSGAIRRAVRRSTFRSLSDKSSRAAYRKFMRRKLRVWSRRFRRGSAGTPRSSHESVSPAVVDQLENLVSRDVRVLFTFGTHDEFYRIFEAARSGPLGDVVRGSNGLIEVSAAIDGRLHDHTSLSAQDELLDMVEEWISHVAEPSWKSPNRLSVDRL